MKKIILILLIEIHCYIGYTQNFKWAKTFGNVEWDFFGEMANDAAGNIYMVGSFEGTVDFDPGSGYFYLTSETANRYDMFILKLDYTGKFLWAKRIGGTEDDHAIDITMDNTGNIYIGGSFGSTVDFNPGSGTFNLTTAGNLDGFVLKLNSSGNFVWAIKVGGTLSDHVDDISIDPVGNIIFTGNFNGTADFDPGSGVYNLTSAGNFDIFISKVNNSGSFIFAEKIGGRGSDRVNDMVLDSSGNIFCTGLFNDTVDFNPDTVVFNLLSSGGDDCFVLKLNNLGKMIWANRIGGTNDQIAFSIAVNQKGNIFVVGNFYSTTDFDPGLTNYNVTSNGNTDMFILSLDSSGSFNWVKTMGSASFENSLFIKLDKQGNIYTTGNFNLTVDFNPGAGTFFITSNGHDDVYILKLDSMGNFLWTKSVGSAEWDNGLSLHIDDTGSVFVVGTFEGAIDLDPGIGSYSTSPQGSYDIFILKLGMSPSYVSYMNGVYTACGGGTYTYSVPPISGATSYFWEIPKGAKIISGQNTDTVRITFSDTSGYVKVTPINSFGSGESGEIFVTVKALPKVTVSITNSSVCAGGPTTITANGAATYTWSPGIGLNTTTGVNVIATPFVTTRYTVTGKNSFGCTDTESVLVTVIPTPIINKHPQSQAAYSGSNIYFIVSTDNSNASLQWQVNPGNGFVNLINSALYSGVQNDTLNLYNITYSLNNYQYRCVISENGCSDTTNSAILSAYKTGLDMNTNVNGYRVYPNPAKEFFTIEAGINLNQIPFFIFDQLGQLIRSGYLENNTNKIELQDLAPGIYLVKIGKTNQETFRLMKY